MPERREYRRKRVGTCVDCLTPVTRKGGLCRRCAPAHRPPISEATRQKMVEVTRMRWARGDFEGKGPPPIRPDVWTDQEDALLHAWAGREPLYAVQARLDDITAHYRSISALEQRCSKLGLSTMVGAHTSTSLRSLLRVGTHKIREWLQKGYITSTRSNATGKAGAHWLVSDDALRTFLLEYRHLYDYRRIRPGVWRRQAEAFHRGDPYMTAREISVAFGINPSTPWIWEKRGLLTGRQRDSGTGGNKPRVYLRSDVLRVIARKKVHWRVRARTA